MRMCKIDTSKDFGSATTATLAFLLWELAITFDDEVEYIWPKPSNAWIKWAFLFSRYFSLALEMAGRGIEFAIFHRVPMSRDALRIWFAFEVVAAHLVMSCLELVMMARVYALYSRSRRLFQLFVALMLMENLVVILSFALTFPKQFDLSLIIACLPKSFAYYTVSVVVTQIIVLSLSAFKYIKEDFKGERIVVVLMRDGTVAFGAICLMSGLIMFWTWADWDTSYTLYPWLIAFCASANCRMIINMQKVPTRTIHSRRTNGYTGPVLTTVVVGSEEDGSETHLLDDLISTPSEFGISTRRSRRSRLFMPVDQHDQRDENARSPGGNSPDTPIGGPGYVSPTTPSRAHFVRPYRDADSITSPITDLEDGSGPGLRPTNVTSTRHDRN